MMSLKSYDASYVDSPSFSTTAPFVSSTATHASVALPMVAGSACIYPGGGTDTSHMCFMVLFYGGSKDSRARVMVRVRVMVMVRVKVK